MASIVVVTGVLLRRIYLHPFLALSKLDHTITTVDQVLQGYENERAREAIFSSEECRCFRARFNRRVHHWPLFG